MVHGICLPLVYSELRWQLELDEDSHYSLCERRLSLPYQSIYSDWGICVGIDGINLAIQVFDFLGGGLIPAPMRLVISAR